MKAQDPRVLKGWVLWAAFLVSHLLMAGLGQLLPDPQTAIPPDQLQPVLIALSAAAVGVLVFAIGVAPRQLAALDPLVLMILRFACAESVTIFGLVLAMLGASSTVSLAFAGFGVLAHLLFAPSEADRRRVSGT